MKKAISLMLSLVLVASILTAMPFTASAASVALDKTKATLAIGEGVKLSLYDGKSNVTSKAKWTSSKKKVATVKNGKVKSKASGKTVILAKYKGKKYKCNIIVKNSVSVDKSKVSIPQKKNSVKVKVKLTENSAIVYKILKGENLVECKWDKKWKGQYIYLTVKRSNKYLYGVAKIKVYSDKHKKNYKIIKVNVKSNYVLEVKHELPKVVHNYESPTTLNPSGMSDSVKINAVYYSMSSLGYMDIDIDLTAVSSAYSTGYYYIFYKIIDPKGYVVESDSIMTERLSEGDKSMENITFYVGTEGTYTIEFLDHYAD